MDEVHPTSEVRTTPRTWLARLGMAARVAQVRLRFVLLLVVAFLVVGQWGTLRNYWDVTLHRLFGARLPEQAVSDNTEFWCPMCPGVISDWPAICPVCNMDLVRRLKGEAPILPDGVVARMQFSPYRIQLAGIRTVTVERRELSREVRLAGRFVEPNQDVARSSPESSQGTGTGPALWLECDAFENDLAELPQGAKASIHCEALAGESPIEGIVSLAPADTVPGRPSTPPRVWVRPVREVPGLRQGLFAEARISLPLTAPKPAREESTVSDDKGLPGIPAVPRTAVVDTGSRRLVYVETMPGMFDGVEVDLGPRCGEFFPVLQGVEPGQKVAAIGAFLIDAEARLDRNQAAAYFGAARSGSAGRSSAASPAVVTRSVRKSRSGKLSAADLAQAKKQKICPVTGADLDSMGGPVPVEVAGRRVFICCQGCEGTLKKDPQKYLVKIPRE